MPAAGWYPDPAGVPGRYRYWDGSRWSTMITDDRGGPSPAESTAGGPAPSEPAKRGPPGRPARRRRLGLIIAVLAVAMSAVVGGFLIGNFRSVVDSARPTAPVSPSDASPDRPPTATQTPSATATPVPLVRCPKGDPNQRARHPVDGRVYGGNLSFEAQPTFEPAALEGRFSFAYDVLQQTLPVSQNPAWIAQLAVGQLRGSDGFVHDARNTVESLARCVITGNMYAPYVPTRGDIRSESLSINGRNGWLIESEITVDQPDLALLGDHVIFIVVRDGKNWGFFFGAVPIGNAQLDAVLARTVRGLRAS
ncbi:MAG TPA: DUF2510 domain-containing protein [Propionibacteriaceae bacterium]|nr:DUF2510 domain-containing protein [Propionibacteriaceae bacterium]